MEDLDCKFLRKEFGFVLKPLDFNHIEPVRREFAYSAGICFVHFLIV